MKVIQELKNPFLKRKEIVFSLEANSVPSKAELVSLLAKEFKMPEESIAIKKVESRFGSKEFKIIAYAYDSVQDKIFIEPKVKKKKSEAQGGGK